MLFRSVSESGEIACDAAVVAAGARSKQLTASIGDRLPLETERGYHVMIENPESGPRNSMMASDAKMVVNWTDKGLRAAGTVEIAGLDAEPNWQRAEILLPAAADDDHRPGRQGVIGARDGEPAQPVALGGPHPQQVGLRERLARHRADVDHTRTLRASGCRAS